MRHRMLILSAAVVALTAGLFAFRASAETRNYGSLTGFNEISSSAGVNVVLKQGPYSVTAEERDGNFDKLVLETRGSKLVIGRKNEWFSFGGGPRYTVTVSAPDITAISASSGSDLDGKGISFRNLEVHISSGADVRLDGQCAELEVHVSSGADFKGEGLKCETARVSASSGAGAHAFATKVAKGDASSGGGVTFHGAPAQLEKHTSSGGSVRSL